MNMFNIKKNYNGFDGLYVIEPTIFQNEQVLSFETFNEKDFTFLKKRFVQDNEAYSKPGVLRGFGINKKNLQAKLIRVIKGKIYDVVIDLRKGSKTFMHYSCIVLSEENHKQLYIPEGFAHAYYALDESNVLFKVSAHFVPGDEITFLWNSKFFNIPWPIDGVPILSDKDKNSPEFNLSILE